MKKIIILKIFLFAITTNISYIVYVKTLINKENVDQDKQVWEKINLFFEQIHNFNIRKMEDLSWENIKLLVTSRLQNINSNIKIEKSSKDKREVCDTDKYFCIWVLVTYNNTKVKYKLFIDSWMLKKEEIKKFINNFYTIEYDWNLNFLNTGYDVLNILRKKMNEINNEIYVDLLYNSYDKKLNSNSISFRIKIIYMDEIIYQTLNLKKILSLNKVTENVISIFNKEYNFDLTVEDKKMLVYEKMQQKIKKIANNIDLNLDKDEYNENLLPDDNIIDFTWKFNNMNFKNSITVKNVKMNESIFWEKVRFSLNKNEDWSVLKEDYVPFLLLTMRKKIELIHSELKIELKENQNISKDDTLDKIDKIFVILKLGEKQMEIEFNFNFKDIKYILNKFDNFFEKTHELDFNIYDTWEKIFNDYIYPNLYLIYDKFWFSELKDLKKAPLPGYSEYDVSFSFFTCSIFRKIKIRSWILSPNYYKFEISKEIKKMELWVVSTWNTYEQIIKELNNNFKKVRINFTAQWVLTNNYITITGMKLLNIKDTLIKNKLTFLIKVANDIYTVKLSAIRTQNEIVDDLRNFFQNENDLLISTLSTSDKITQNLIEKISKIYIFINIKSLIKLSNSKEYEILINIFNNDYTVKLKLKNIFNFDQVKKELDASDFFIFPKINENINNRKEYVEQIEIKLKNILKTNHLLIESNYEENIFYNNNFNLELGIKILWNGDTLEKKINIPLVVLLNELKTIIYKDFNQYYDFCLSVNNTYEDAILKINEKLKEIDLNLTVRLNNTIKNENLKYAFDNFMVDIYYNNSKILEQFNLNLKNVRFDHEEGIRKIDKIIKEFWLYNFDNDLNDIKNNLAKIFKKDVNDKIEVEIFKDYNSKEIKILVYFNSDLIIYKF